MTSISARGFVEGEDSLTRLESLCGRLADLAVVISISVVPLCLGGRIALGQLLLLSCALLAALGWSGTVLFGRQTKYVWTKVEILLLGSLGIGLLQLTPLPSGLLNWLSPHQGKLLPTWTDAAGSLGVWRTLSLNVVETRSGVIVGLCYVLLFWVTSQRIRHVSDIERLLKAVAISAAGMAIFGAVQWLLNNGKFFWLFDYPLTSPEHRMKGAFTNRNHFAQFLVLGCGPLLWWIVKVLNKRASGQSQFGVQGRHRSEDDTVLGSLLLVLAVVIFAVMFSLSRGGMIALGTSLLVMVIALFRIGVLSGRVLGSFLAIAAVTGCLFVTLGHEKVSERLDNWQSDSRLAIWQANLDIVKHFPLFGTGLGTHAEAYHLFYDPPFVETEFTHAENSYLQVASELGLCGLLLVGSCLFCCATWCWRGFQNGVHARERTIAASITASLLANAVHALVDFVWYVPGLITVVVVLAASARRLDQLSKSPSHAGHSAAMRPVVPRGLGWISAAATLLIGWWSFTPTLRATVAEPDWFEYLRLTMRAPETERNSSEFSDAEATESEESDTTESVIANDLVARFKQRVAALNRVTKQNPDHVRAHDRLASLYVNAFNELQRNSENPMSLAQLRDAALSSPFESVEAVREWMQRATGSNLKYLFAANAHAEQAVRRCPLYASAYVNLSGLSFLENRDPARAKELLQQALLVRPHSAQVRFVVGREAMQEGRMDDAIQAWKAAFQQHRGYQKHILNLLMRAVAPQVILTNFDPGLSVLEQMEAYYRNFPNQYAVVARAYAQQLRDDTARPDCERPIEQLLKAATVYQRLDEPNEAELCYRRAIDNDSGSVAARRTYGHFLIEQERFADAAEQLKVGLRLAPGDDSLRRLAKVAAEKSLRSDSQTILPTKFQRRR